MHRSQATLPTVSCGDLEHLAPALQQIKGGPAGARRASCACPDGRCAPTGGGANGVRDSPWPRARGARRSRPASPRSGPWASGLCPHMAGACPPTRGELARVPPPPIDCVELRLVRRASVQQQSLTRTCLAACVLSMSSLFQLACVHACICVASHRVVYATTAVTTKICIALLCVPWLASHASLTTLW